MLIATATFAVESAKASASELHIHVTGLRSSDGMIHYAVFDSPKHFPSGENPAADGKVQASADGVSIVVRGLKPGSYAVAVFHDENRNDEFDQGLFGFPLEQYGFSNNARSYFSAPDFNDARFELRGPRTRISIDLGR